MPTGVATIQALVMGGKVYIGGEDNFYMILDTVIGKWYVATPLPIGKFRASITAIHDTLYIL